MTVRVRFAPSPTGKVHIGNLRAAIYNWLFARHEGGKFLLRIEDTDRERSTGEAIQVLLDSLEWVGLDWDEEPVYQSPRMDVHTAAADRLLSGKMAYMAPPRLSRWALLDESEIGAAPREVRDLFGRLATEENQLRRAHFEAFESANAKRPKKKQRSYMAPLLFRVPVGDQGKAALHFRLPPPWEASPLIEETEEIRELEVYSPWPVLISSEGIEFIPAARIKGEKPLESALFDVESRSLCGFAGLEILDSEGQILFGLDQAKSSLMEGRIILVPQAKVLRFRRRYVGYQDLVKGELRKPLEGLKNRVLVRSDGTPVFHLANVVDDHDMEITHILRGDDHVENTYWHLLLFGALGWKPPRYGHFPMIVNEKGRPLSKRDGDVYVGEYRNKGILPEALFNYLALLGWSPGEGEEMVSRSEMVARFTLDRVISTAARFDSEKMLWMNSRYLAQTPVSRLTDLALPFLSAAGIDVSGRDRAWLEEVVGLERERIHSLAELPSEAGFFFASQIYPDLGNKKVKKVLSTPGLDGILGDLIETLRGLSSFTPNEIEAALRLYAEEKGIGMGKVSQPLRVAVTGRVASPPIGETLFLVGFEEVLRRVEAFRSGLNSSQEEE